MNEALKQLLDKYKDRELMMKISIDRVSFDFKKDLDTQYEIGSQTKTFTVLSILKLIEDKKIQFTDLVKDVLGEEITNKFEGIPGVDFKKITIHNLVFHHAKLPDYVNVAGFGNDEETIKMLKDKVNLKFNIDLVVEYIKKYNNNPTPEGQYYSNTGYYLLGLIIEKVTGKKYEEFLNELIINPLGLKDTGMIKNPKQGWFKGEKINPMETTFTWSAGGLMSTINDMERLFTAIRDENAILSKETFKLWKEECMKEENKQFGGSLINVGGMLGFAGGTFGYTSWTLYANGLWVIFGLNEGNSTIMQEVMGVLATIK